MPVHLCSLCRGNVGSGVCVLDGSRSIVGLLQSQMVQSLHVYSTCEKNLAVSVITVYPWFCA